jgi:Uma2 family endonuclease
MPETITTTVEQRTVWTYDDYAALPDDGNRYEVFDGELVMAPAPTVVHQVDLLNLIFAVRQHVKSHKLGECLAAPCDVILDERTVVQPDLIFVSNERSSIVTEKNIQGAPDLLVEVLSPSTAGRDRVVKLRLYARFGVPHYWLIDLTEKIFEVFELDGTSYRLAVVLGEAEPALRAGAIVVVEDARHRVRRLPPGS